MADNLLALLEDEDDDVVWVTAAIVNEHFRNTATASSATEFMK
jgi:hypothetical protein